MRGGVRTSGTALEGRGTREELDTGPRGQAQQRRGFNNHGERVEDGRFEAEDDDEDRITVVGGGVAPKLSQSTPRGQSTTRTESTVEGDTDATEVDGMEEGTWAAPPNTRRPFAGESMKLGLRVLDMFLNLAAISMQRSYIEANLNTGNNLAVSFIVDRLFSIPLVFCIAWQIAELTTHAARRGRGITPKAHIGVEITICIFMFILIALVAVSYHLAANRTFERETQTAFLAVLTIISIIHIYFFLDACVRRHREIKTPHLAQIMYIPETGETIYIVPKPQTLQDIPLLPTRKPSVLRSRTSAPPTPRLPPDEAAVTAPETTREGGPQRTPVDVQLPKPDDGQDVLLEALSMPRGETVSGPQATTPLPANSLAHGATFLTPPKPIPVDSLHPPMRPGHEPPGLDYVPDEAELERRARGDAQPQMMSPNDMSFKFSASNTGMTPVANRPRDPKVLLMPGKPQRSHSF